MLAWQYLAPAPNANGDAPKQEFLHHLSAYMTAKEFWCFTDPEAGRTDRHHPGRCLGPVATAAPAPTALHGESAVPVPGLPATPADHAQWEDAAPSIACPGL